MKESRKIKIILLQKHTIAFKILLTVLSKHTRKPENSVLGTWFFNIFHGSAPSHLTVWSSTPLYDPCLCNMVCCIILGGRGPIKQVCGGPKTVTLLIRVVGNSCQPVIGHGFYLMVSLLDSPPLCNLTILLSGSFPRLYLSRSSRLVEV